MKTLLETGVHFGHRTQKWNPDMQPYIFTERNGVHIIDLQQTLRQIEESYELVRNIVADGGTMLFVGTKRQAKDVVQSEAERCDMPFVVNRWLGGMLTNWRTIKERITELERLERGRDDGTWESLKKKERLSLQRKADKLTHRLGGIRSMHDLPQIVCLVDVQREYTALREANRLDIPVLAMVDTNCNPSRVDHLIACNDDAIRAIKLIIGYLADAVIEGRALRKDDELVEDADGVSDYAPDMDATSDEELLGAATLAKLSSGELDFGDQPKPDAKTTGDASRKPETTQEVDDNGDAAEENISTVASEDDTATEHPTTHDVSDETDGIQTSDADTSSTEP